MWTRVIATTLLWLLAQSRLRLARSQAAPFLEFRSGIFTGRNLLVEIGYINAVLTDSITVTCDRNSYIGTMHCEAVCRADLPSNISASGPDLAPTNSVTKAKGKYKASAIVSASEVDLGPTKLRNRGLK